MNRYARIFVSLCALACLLAAVGASAQDYPSRPIKVVVPYPAGDLADVIARLLGNEMAKELGQPLVVENRAGASGLIGLQVVANAEPDGYTLVLGQMGSVAVAPNINKWPFKVREVLDPVAMAYTNYMMLVTTPSLPVKTLPELIAYSKAHPGLVRAATNGAGGFPHLAIELLRKQAGFDFSHIPYRGSSQILSDVMAGRVEMTIFGYSGLYPYVQDGRLRGIAVSGRRRAPNAPDIPTVGETVPSYEALGWFGYFAPKGTPAAVVNKINAAVNHAIAAPDVQEQARRQGLDPSPGTPADFAQAWKTDYDKWGGIIRDLGLEGSGD
jgi:tripartite-type tricarboxylate transporter receptor subunit TctC